MEKGLESVSDCQIIRRSKNGCPRNDWRPSQSKYAERNWFVTITRCKLGFSIDVLCRIERWINLAISCCEMKQNVG